jgi:hypothetical protein
MRRSPNLALPSFLLAVSFAGCLAQQPPGQPNPAPLRKSEVAVYSAKLIDTEGVTGTSSPADLLIKMLRCSFPEELSQLEEIRVQKDYRDKLPQALLNHAPIGEFRIGLELARSFKLIACRETPKGRTLLMAANRFSMPGANAGTAQDAQLSVHRYRPQPGCQRVWKRHLLPLCEAALQQETRGGSRGLSHSTC